VHVVNDYTAGVWAAEGFRVFQDAVMLLEYNGNLLPMPFVGDLDFAVAAGVNSVIKVEPRVNFFGTLRWLATISGSAGVYSITANFMNI
jgi:hypothetical protein